MPDYDITAQAMSGVPDVTGEAEGSGPAESSVPTRQGNWAGAVRPTCPSTATWSS